jgi:hypothetical protein
MSSSLTALSPLDGRYAAKTRALQEHFSEFALMRERVAVEVEWLIALGNEREFTAMQPFSADTQAQLRRAALQFGQSGVRISQLLHRQPDRAIDGRHLDIHGRAPDLTHCRPWHPPSAVEPTFGHPGSGESDTQRLLD